MKKTVFECLIRCSLMKINGLFYETLFIASLYGWDYYVCIDTIFVSNGYVDLLNPSLLLNWMFEHKTGWTHAVLGVFYVCFVFLHLLLFSTTEHDSHGKVLQKYAHYYYYCQDPDKQLPCLQHTAWLSVLV